MTISRVLPSICLAIAVLAQPAIAGSMTTIKTEDQFRKIVVGKKIVDPKSGAWTQPKANGSVVGGFQGQKIKGAWNWQNGMYCRHLIIGKKDTGTDCVIFQSDGTKGSYRTKMGKGEKKSFVLK
ncbi:hypothetical protein [Marimonas lutisalis]|uniref:hypothetical protein n=1 Tax=Marimonas lutisalis TaxID=2545756 RepID=UPI0010F7F29F|nr:hypothetical protein [Marimonas lutisalis]